MRVSDILKLKGNTLFTVTPDSPLNEAVNTMAEHDIGSLVVMEYGDLVGMLTFREIILVLSRNGGSSVGGSITVRFRRKNGVNRHYSVVVRHWSTLLR